MEAVITVSLALALMQTTAPAQDPSPPEPGTPDESEQSAQTLPPAETGSIIVEGRRLEEVERAARAQVRATLAGANKGIPTPRYFDDLCLSLNGFPEDLSDPFENRIRDNALRVGAPVAPARMGCRPNAIISLSPDPAALLNRARTRQPWIFAGARQSVIRRLAKRSSGAIAWSLVECRRADGRPTGEIRLNGKPEPRTGFSTCETARDNGGIPPKNINQIILSVVLLDRRLIDGMTIEQVADYATMRILLLVDPRVEFRQNALPSVLTLFAEKDPDHEGLTEMDLALLSATYQSGPTDLTYAASREAARRLIEGDLPEDATEFER